jgi:phospholipid/cholesterol/gamma-HCH transport system substrate-binding protein
VEREANYAAVGAFVVLVIVMAGLFVYWYTESRGRSDYVRYEIYFTGSVSGLQRGASVRFLGVEVGRVDRLSVDRRASGRVQVIASIDTAAPITANTVAQLSLQGITGLLFIDLGERQPGIEVETGPSERYPVIPSVTSGFDRLLASLPELVAKANAVMERVEEAVSTENVAAISRVITNVEQASTTLPATMREAQALVQELRIGSRDLIATLATLRELSARASPEVDATVVKLRAAAGDLADASARLDQFIAANQGELTAFTREGLPEAQRMLEDARQAAAEFRDLSRTLREQPSSLLFQPNYFGVEVPR